MQWKVQKGEEHTFSLYTQTQNPVVVATTINFQVTDSRIRLVTVMTLKFTQCFPIPKKTILFALFILL
jgi:hypothetical protein